MSLLEEINMLFQRARLETPFYGDKINAYLYSTDERTLRAWKMLLTIPTILFPEPESHLHYKCRVFGEWVKSLPSRIRWWIFPYHLIHREDYEDLVDDY